MKPLIFSFALFLVTNHLIFRALRLYLLEKISLLILIYLIMHWDLTG